MRTRTRSAGIKPVVSIQRHKPLHASSARNPSLPIPERGENSKSAAMVRRNKVLAEAVRGKLNRPQVRKPRRNQKPGVMKTGGGSNALVLAKDRKTALTISEAIERAYRTKRNLANRNHLLEAKQLNNRICNIFTESLPPPSSPHTVKIRRARGQASKLLHSNSKASSKSEKKKPRKRTQGRAWNPAMTKGPIVTTGGGGSFRVEKRSIAQPNDDGGSAFGDDGKATKGTKNQAQQPEPNPPPRPSHLQSIAVSPVLALKPPGIDEGRKEGDGGRGDMTRRGGSRSSSRKVSISSRDENTGFVADRGSNSKKQNKLYGSMSQPSAADPASVPQFESKAAAIAAAAAALSSKQPQGDSRLAGPHSSKLQPTTTATTTAAAAAAAVKATRTTPGGQGLASGDPVLRRIAHKIAYPSPSPQQPPQSSSSSNSAAVSKTATAAAAKQKNTKRRKSSSAYSTSSHQPLAPPPTREQLSSSDTRAMRARKLMFPNPEGKSKDGGEKSKHPIEAVEEERKKALEEMRQWERRRQEAYIPSTYSPLVHDQQQALQQISFLLLPAALPPPETPLRNASPLPPRDNRANRKAVAPDYEEDPYFSAHLDSPERVSAALTTHEIDTLKQLLNRKLPELDGRYRGALKRIGPGGGRGGTADYTSPLGVLAAAREDFRHSASLLNPSFDYHTLHKDHFSLLQTLGSLTPSPLQSILSAKGRGLDPSAAVAAAISGQGEAAASGRGRFSLNEPVVLVGLSSKAPAFDGRVGRVRGPPGPSGRIPVFLAAADEHNDDDDYSSATDSGGGGKAGRGGNTVYVKPENLAKPHTLNALQGAGAAATDSISKLVDVAVSKADKAVLEGWRADRGSDRKGRRGKGKKKSITLAIPGSSSSAVAGLKSDRKHRDEKEGGGSPRGRRRARKADGGEGGGEEHFSWWFSYLQKVEEYTRMYSPEDPPLPTERPAAGVDHEMALALVTQQQSPPQQQQQQQVAVLKEEEHAQHSSPSYQNPKMSRHRPENLLNLTTKPEMLTPPPSPLKSRGDGSNGGAASKQAPTSQQGYYSREGKEFTKVADIAPPPNLLVGAAAAADDDDDKASLPVAAGRYQDFAYPSSMADKQTKEEKVRNALDESLREERERKAIENEQSRVLHRLRQRKFDMLIEKEQKELALIPDQNILENQRRVAVRRALMEEAESAREAARRAETARKLRQKQHQQEQEAMEAEAEAKKAKEKLRGSRRKDRPTAATDAKTSPNRSPDAKEKEGDNDVDDDNNNNNPLHELLAYAKGGRRNNGGGGGATENDWHWGGGPGMIVPQLYADGPMSLIHPRPSNRPDEKGKHLAEEEARQQMRAKAREKLVLTLAGDDSKIIQGELGIALEIGIPEGDNVIQAARQRIRALEAICEEKSKEEKKKLLVEAARAAMKEMREKCLLEEKREMERRQKALEDKILRIDERAKEREKVTALELKVAALTAAASVANASDNKTGTEALLFAERTERLREDVRRELESTRSALSSLRGNLAEQEKQRESLEDQNMLESLGRQIQAAVEGAVSKLGALQKQKQEDQKPYIDDETDWSLSTSMFSDEDRTDGEDAKQDGDYDDLLSEGEIPPMAAISAGAATATGAAQTPMTPTKGDERPVVLPSHSESRTLSEGELSPDAHDYKQRRNDMTTA
eukprot:jgi/Bigna1/76692/fgenesh1_pg.43_\